MTLSQSDRDLINYCGRSGEFGSDADYLFDKHIERLIAWKHGLTDHFEPLHFGWPRVQKMRWITVVQLRKL